MKAIILLSLIFFSGQVLATNYYFNAHTTHDIADYGDDSRSAATAQNPLTPWASIDKLNTVWAAGTFAPGDQILLKRGETFYTSTGILIKEGGTLGGGYIHVVAYGSGARPIVTGLTNLTFQNLSGNLWRSIETLAPDAINCVTINGVTSQMARFPQKGSTNYGGYDTAQSASSSSITISSGAAAATGHPAYYVGAQVVYKSDRFEIQRQVINSFSSNVIGFTKANSSDGSPQTDWGYFIEDDSSILSYQNAWWFKKNKYLKIYSVGSPANVAAATCTNLVTTLGNYTYVSFDNINFNGCNGDVVYLNSGDHINFNNCIIQNGGRNGVKLLRPNCNVTNDSIVNNLSKGITTGAGANHCTFSNNIIRNSGVLEGHGDGNIEDTHANHSGVGIYILDDTNDDFTIENNTVVNSGYAGIQFKRQNNIVIRYNRVDSACIILDDGGCVYTVENDDVPRAGRVISYNVISNAVGTHAGWKSGGDNNPGIYCDNGTNNVDITGNTVFNCNDGIFCNNGADHIIMRNNVIYNCVNGIQINTRTANSGYAGQSRFFTITNNLIFVKNSGNKAVLFHNGDNDVFTAFGTIDSNQYIKPISPASLLATENPNATHSFKSWKALYTYDNNSDTTHFFYMNSSDQSNNTLFAYNPTGSPITKDFPGLQYKDNYDGTFNNSAPIGPYGSIILFYSGTTGPPPPPPGIQKIHRRGKLKH